MTHRAEQVLEAAAAAIALSTTFQGTVFKHRALSLSETAADELPAISVDFGEDTPADDDGASNLAFLDSLLTIETTIYLTADTEEDLRTKLLEGRSSIHVELMKNDRTLGLAFVIDTRYAGADKPAVDTEKEFLAGSLVCRWRVHYRMNVLDPN